MIDVKQLENQHTCSNQLINSVPNFPSLEDNCGQFLSPFTSIKYKSHRRNTLKKRENEYKKLPENYLKDNCVEKIICT